uniref:Uncharacterized protein n=1 Tax=Anguilla anguilla TaxID=7936 RepID=A0A0E9PP29_ANGAN
MTMNAQWFASSPLKCFSTVVPTA